MLNESTSRPTAKVPDSCWSVPAGRLVTTSVTSISGSVPTVTEKTTSAGTGTARATKRYRPISLSAVASRIWSWCSSPTAAATSRPR